MNLEVIKNAVTSKAARQILLTKKHSPKILFVAGTVGVVGTVVLACRATLKVSDKLDEHEENADLIRKTFAQASTTEKKQPGFENALQRDLNKLKLKTSLEIVKPFLPAIGLGALSITALTGSHVILTKRNSTLMAGYVALDRAFKEYRERVSDEYGKDADRRFATGASEHLSEEKLADGSIKITNKDAVDGRFGGSPYAVVFDEISNKFSKEPGRNAHTIMMIQSYANDKLKANGHLFLNEVKDMLGLPRTPAGQIVGWVYDPKNENHKGDNFVDFGVWTGESELVGDFIDGKYYTVTLDFNVDGPVYDQI